MLYLKGSIVVIGPKADLWRPQPTNGSRLFDCLLYLGQLTVTVLLITAVLKISLQTKLQSYTPHRRKYAFD